MSDDPLVRLAGLDGVGSAVAAATAAVDVVLRDRGVRRFDDRRRAAAAVRSARADAALVEGFDADVVTAAGLRVVAELPALAGVVLTAPAQAIARAHAVWGRGLIPDVDLGRISGSAELTDRVGGLTAMMAAPSRAPALVRAAVVHAELATAAPFTAGSEPVARWIERAVLVAAGVDPGAVLPVQAGHRDPAAYRVAMTGYREGGPDGVRRWLLYSCDVVAAAAEMLVSD